MEKKLSLANKYRPKVFEDLSEQTSVKTILENQIANKNIKHAYLFCGGAGTGKCLTLNSDIMTVNGYKKMKDIHIGDRLIDGLGKECKVIGVYPQGKKPVYKVTFSDRTNTLCSLDHIWRVGWYSNHNKTVKWDDLTLEQILEKGLKKCNNKKGYKYRIPTPIIDCWDNEIELDPYLLGVLLCDGDLGSAKSIKVSIYEDDIKLKIDHILNSCGYELHLCSIKNSDKKDYSIVRLNNPNGFIHYIDKLNLRCKSIEKHIPKEYLYTSVENRIKLLQGLFDINGYIDKYNNYIFTTSSPQLSKDFAFLIRSLGGTDTIVEKKSRYKKDGVYINCENHFNHTINLSNISFCTSLKHKSKLKDKQNKPQRRIAKIEYAGEEECQCIAVDSIDSTYMTNDLIVTHNTTTARIIASMINEGKGRTIEIDCASNNGVDDMRRLQEDCRDRPIDCKYKIYLLDECFVGNTKVQTEKGKIDIKNINIGDYVYTSSGLNKVINKHVTKVDNNRLCNIKFDNDNIITVTKNHLFMTTNGWIEACKLKQGDELIVQSELSKLWKTDNYIQKREKILQQRMLPRMDTYQSIQYSAITEEMYNMWKEFFGENVSEECKNLFYSMQKQINIAIRKDYNEFRVWDGTKETIFKKNVGTQSNEFCRDYKENEEDERIEWNIKSTNQEQRRQWTIYRTSIEIIQQFRRFLDYGVGNTYKDKAKQQSQEISYSIQSRPWLLENENSNRGRWETAQYERWYTERYKKANKARRIRVESVALQERSDNEQSNRSTGGYTEVYDLEIENDHSYFVENVLVHNCHMLTVQAWNSLLKILEEPPDYVVFLMCTTDPQKILPTILSRVQRFNFNRISTEGIIKRLKVILEKENITDYENSAIEYIARLAKGGMRDAITTLEKCLDFDKYLTLEVVHKVMSGGVSEETMLNLMRLILDRNAKDALIAFNDVYMSGMDTLLFLKLYIEFIENCIKYIITSDTNIITISDISVNWLKNNTQFLEDIRGQLMDLLRIRSGYSSEDLKIILESWIVKECNL